MKNFILLCGIAMVILFSSSCSEDQISLVAELDCSYLKARGGTEWTYFNGSSTATSSIIADTIINGNTILIGVNEGNPSQKSYVGCLPNGFIIVTPDATTTGGTNVGLIVLEFDFSNPLGVEWDGPQITTTNAGFTTVNDYTLSVQEENLTMEVQGTTYSDVKKVRLRVLTSGDLIPDPIELSRAEYYLAPEVGLIRSVILTMDFDGNWVPLGNSIDLQSYDY